MRSISVQADPALESVAREWIVHLLVAMPVLPNQGIIFDSLRPGETQTHVNHRKPETWTVSFRGGPNGPDTGHYRNPIAAAEAIIDRRHNGGKNN
jgi:hypothetical protein